MYSVFLFSLLPYYFTKSTKTERQKKLKTQNQKQSKKISEFLSNSKSLLPSTGKKCENQSPQHKEIAWKKSKPSVQEKHEKLKVSSAEVVRECMKEKEP